MRGNIRACAEASSNAASSSRAAQRRLYGGVDV